MLREMRSDVNGADSDLQIRGLPVTRAQFNVVYADLVDYIHAIKKLTGQQPKNVDLEGAVTILSDHPAAEGAYTAVYIGRYLGKPVSSISDILGVILYS